MEKLQPNSCDRTRDNENKLKTMEFSLSMWETLVHCEGDRTGDLESLWRFHPWKYNPAGPSPGHPALSVPALSGVELHDLQRSLPTPAVP